MLQMQFQRKTFCAEFVHIFYIIQSSVKHMSHIIFCITLISSSSISHNWSIIIDSTLMYKITSLNSLNMINTL